MEKTRFHEYLTRFRKLRGYTQAQMAENLKISRSTYTNYEIGHRSPDLATLRRISEVLNCSTDELLGKFPQSQITMLAEGEAIYGAKVNKKLAVGMQDFRSLREQNGYYVDKTNMIYEFLESGNQVTLITRPRRFGKTMNMSMLAEFLDCTKSSKDLFTDTKINRTLLCKEMNEHPVVWLSFLDVKGDTAEEMLYQLMYVLKNEYEKFIPILHKGGISKAGMREIDEIYQCLCQRKDEKKSRSFIRISILALCQALQEYYGKKVYLLLDEYDTPFISANVNGYYKEIRGVLSGMLSASLKGNSALEKAMITGIQRVAKENIFSGLNNLVVCTVCDPEYSQCFGFTEEETARLLEYYGLTLSEDVKAMYDGYRFGMTEVYNPWSVVFYASRKRLDPYWINTSENSIIKHALAQRGETFAREYRRLIENGEVTVNVELTTSYYEQPDDASLWGLLLNAGMLTVQEHQGDGFYQLRIPNYEVRRAFQNLTAFYLKIEEGHIAKMLRCLRKVQLDEFAEEYQHILLELPSYYDLKSENSYHMMMLGMCAFLYEDYEVRSNRESGKGRSDILLCAKDSQCPNMILEFKYAREEGANLGALAQEAIVQIKEKNYDVGMKGVAYYIGIAHYGKKASVKWEKK